MKRRKKNKLLIIGILVVTIMGLSIGLATFSNFLTISSSATVKPNAEEYNLVLYGWNIDPFYSDASSMDEAFEKYSSTTTSIPHSEGTRTVASPAVIDNNAFAIRNISAQFMVSTLSELSNERVDYIFVIKNEGAYPIYFDYLKISDLFESALGKSCIATDSSMQDAVDSYCDYINAYVSLGNGTVSSEGVGFSRLDIDAIKAAGEYKLDAGEIVTLAITILGNYIGEVSINSEFSVYFDDVTLDFATSNIFAE